MIKRIILLVIICTLGLSTPALAADAGNGIIEGHLINGTEGGSSVADQDITLKAYLGDAEVSSATTKTDAEGFFAFENLSTEPDYVYEIKVIYQQAEYFSEWLSFNMDETTKYAEMTVYDATDSDDVVITTMLHTVIYFGQDSLQVKEYYLLANDSDRTYIGSKEIAEGVRQTLNFPLPADASELQSTSGLMECCIYTSEEGFVDSMPLLPGMKEVAYSYEIDRSSTSYTFSRKINYPTISYSFLVQGAGIDVTVNSDQLSEEEPIEIEGTLFRLFSGSNFKAGDILYVELSGLPKSDSSPTILWTILTAVALAGGFGIIYTLRKKQPQPALTEAGPEQIKQKLLTELAQFDDDYESGKIDEESYQKQRARTKSRLVNIMQSAERHSGSK